MLKAYLFEHLKSLLSTWVCKLITKVRMKLKYLRDKADPKLKKYSGNIQRSCFGTACRSTYFFWFCLFYGLAYFNAKLNSISSHNEEVCESVFIQVLPTWHVIQLFYQFRIYEHWASSILLKAPFLMDLHQSEL